MKLFSDATEYGLRAVLWLAEQPRDLYSVREIAEATKSAPGYLAKVMQSLARAGIVSATRGQHGGFRLGREPSDIVVLEVIEAIDPLERIRTCPLNLEAHRTRLCPLHHRLDGAIAHLREQFGGVTMADLLNEAEPGTTIFPALATEATP